MSAPAWSPRGLGARLRGAGPHTLAPPARRAREGDAGRRAQRTGSAVRAGTDRLWPHWLERQLDPASPAFVPGDDLVANVTGRSWTVVGNVGSGSRARVDQRGLVCPGGWSLDWWVGAEDRWHLPSREVAVRQRLLTDAPVVETAMRVPGGDVVQRVYGIRSAPRDGGDELVVVEVENATPVPVALAVAVRPYDLDGVTVVERIGLEGSSVTIDGRVAVLLPRAPNRVAGSAFDEGDVATPVLGAEAGTTFPAELRCGVGLASAAFVYPLPHRSTLSFLVPLEPGGPAGGRGRSSGAARRAPSAVPTAAQVANGWRAHAGRGLRLVLPDSRLSTAVEANRRHLLLLGGAGGQPSPSSPEEAVAVLGALDRYGYRDEAAEVLAAHPARQRADGSFPAGAAGATGAALHALGEHWRLHRDAAAVEGLEPVLAAAAEVVERALAGAGRQRRDGRRTGLALAEDLWGVRGLLDAGAVLAALGEEGAAAAARAGAERAHAGGDEVLDAWASGPGTAGSPAGRQRGVDLSVLEVLRACWPLRLAGADDHRVVAAADAVRRRSCHGPAVFDGAGHTGLRPRWTLGLALVELEAGDRRALDRLDWLLSVATPTWAWPEAVHPRTDGGSAGDGHHAGTAADLLTLVRNLLVRDTADGLALCSLLPAHWLGAPLEVHDAPTHAGSLSYAVRWHGDRPALLWELVPHGGGAGERLTAPGLDPTWSTTELRGDALLEPVPVPPSPPAVAAPEPEAPVTPVRLSRRRPPSG